VGSVVAIIHDSNNISKSMSTYVSQRQMFVLVRHPGLNMGTLWVITCRESEHTKRETEVTSHVNIIDNFSLEPVIIRKQNYLVKF
jgi:hypothetical protein